MVARNPKIAYFYTVQKPPQALEGTQTMKSFLNSPVALAVGRNRTVFIVALFAALLHGYFITHPADFPIVANNLWFFKAMIPLSFSIIPLLWTPKASKPTVNGPKRAIYPCPESRISFSKATQNS